MYASGNEGPGQDEPPLVHLEDSNSLGLNIRLKDGVVSVCGTVLVTLILALVLVTLTGCCCRKRKKTGGEQDSDEEDSEETAGAAVRAKVTAKVTEVRRSDSSKQRQTGVTALTIEGQSANTTTIDPTTVPGQQSGEADDGPSVRDRIKAFETVGSDTSKTSAAGGNKPRKKKPNSKAFEEFESTGIIMGLNKFVSKRRLSSEGEAGPQDVTSIEEEDEFSGPAMQLIGLTSSYEPSTEDSMTPTSPISKSGEEDEGIHTMDSEEDEFSAVPRNSEILKSFRRVPPPRVRRSLKKGQHKEGDVQGSETLSWEETSAEAAEKSEDVQSQDSAYCLDKFLDDHNINTDSLAASSCHVSAQDSAVKQADERSVSYSKRQDNSAFSKVGQSGQDTGADKLKQQHFQRTESDRVQGTGTGGQLAVQGRYSTDQSNVTIASTQRHYNASKTSERAATTEQRTATSEKTDAAGHRVTKLETAI